MKMKIPNVPKWALVFTLSAGIVASGCKKYDDDISRLEKDINAGKSAIDELKQQIQNGKYVKNVTSTDEGVNIEFSDGQSILVKNGTNGTNGDDGTSPVITAGEDGFWYINSEKTEASWKGEDGQDGKDGKDGEDGQEGKDGQDGKDAVVTIGADGFWYINGVKTATRAQAGVVAVVASDKFYSVTFTDAETGVTTETIKLPRVSLYVTSLSFIPKYNFGLSGTPVIVIPRIVEGVSYSGTTVGKTLLQGGADLSYAINPSSIDPEAFVVEDLVKQTTENIPAFRASASGFTFGHQQVTDGVLNVFATPGAGYDPSKSGLFEDQDFYALVVKNLNKPTETTTEGKVVSNYVATKDERLLTSDLYLAVVNGEGDQGYTPEEYTIKTNLIADRNEDLPDDGDFTRTPEISLEIGKTVDLSAAIRAFFRRVSNNEYKSFDDHGLKDYTLKFEPLAYNLQGVDQTNEYVDVTEAGVVSLKAGKGTSAIGRTPIVKVSLLGDDATAPALVHTTVKLVIGAEVKQPSKVIGKIGTTDDIENGDRRIFYRNENGYGPTFFNVHLDPLFDELGVSKAEFLANYEFIADDDAASNDNDKFTVDWDPSITSENRLSVESISSNLPAGTYKVTGKFKDKNGITSVDFEGTIVIENPNGGHYLDKQGDWFSGNGLVSYGKAVNNHDWSFEAVTSDSWKLTQPTVPSPGAAVAHVVYELDGAQPGVTVNAASGLVTITDEDKYLVDGELINLVAYVYLNNDEANEVDPVQTEKFTLQFRDPVGKVTTTSVPTLTDINPTLSQIDLKKYTKLVDHKNVVIFEWNNTSNAVAKNNGLINQYSLKDAVFSYDPADNPHVTQDVGQQINITPNGELTFGQTSVALQEEITIKVRVSVESWDYQRAEDIIEVKIKPGTN